MRGMRPVPVADELPLVTWPPPEPFEYAADVVDGGWPPPEPFDVWAEERNTGWPPAEPLEEWAIVAEEAWDTTDLSDDPDWPPADPDERESAADPDADAWYAPAVKAKPRRRADHQPRAEPMGDEWRELAEHAPRDTPRDAPTAKPIEPTPSADLLAKVELVEIDDYGQETVVPLE